MPERRRWTVRDLRRDNRCVLLWSLYFDQPRSRPDLSEATGLSSASVSNVIRELIHEGIVIEAGSVDSDGGRPRVLLRINPDYGYVVGIDVGEHAPHHMSLALATFAAHDGAGGARHLDGAVARIIVVNEDFGLRQRLAKIVDHGRDRGFLVVARHQNRNPQR